MTKVYLIKGSEGLYLGGPMTTHTWVSGSYFDRSKAHSRLYELQKTQDYVNSQSEPSKHVGLIQHLDNKVKEEFDWIKFEIEEIWVE